MMAQILLDFEGSISEMLENGWSFDPHGDASSVYTTSDRAYKGDQSLFMDSSDNVEQRIAYTLPEARTNIRVSVYVYDDGQTSGHNLMGVFDADDASVAGRADIGWTSEFGVLNQYKSHAGTLSSWAAIGILRTIGWHRLAIEVTPTEVRYYFDGWLVRTSNHISQVKVVRFACGNHGYGDATGTTWFDNLQIFEIEEIIEPDLVLAEVLPHPTGAGPQGVAVDAGTGNVWISSDHSGPIQEMSPTWSVISGFGTPQGDSQALDIDNSTGSIWHMEAGTGARIYEFSKSGQLLSSFQPPSEIFYQDVQGIAYDNTTGRIWLTTHYPTGTIYEADASRTLLSSIHQPIDMAFVLAVDLDEERDVLWMAATDEKGWPILASFDRNGNHVQTLSMDRNFPGAYSNRFSFNDLAVNGDDFWLSGSSAAGQRVYYRFTLQDYNEPPIVSANGPYTTPEGSTVTLTATASDPDGDEVTLVWDLDGDGTFETPGAEVEFSAAQLDGPSSVTVAVQATDTGGLTATAEATIEVTNVAPAIESLVASVDPVALGDDVLASASFSDPGIPDTHTALFDWGDGQSSPGVVNQENDSVEGTHTYAAPGLYTVGLTVTDDDGGADTAFFEYVVVFDPEGGFVTGGGWIDSPVGACTYADCIDETTGKASFGFVSKYKKKSTVPGGQTQFTFKAGDLSFHIETYEWLIVNKARAKYKGNGRINGEGDYGFMISVVDADLTPSTDVDLFRMKIWDKSTDEVVYDNQRGEPDDADAATAIGGGSIKIHKAVDYDGAAKVASVEESESAVPSAFALRGNYPNPFNPSTSVVYDVPEKGEVTIEVYDAVGQLVSQLATGIHEAGSHQVVFDATSRPSGIYFAVMTSPAGRFTQKMVLVK